ncbi:MAG: GAF domain-containing protein, partial [Rubrobacteraceae bacterium]
MQRIRRPAGGESDWAAWAGAESGEVERLERELAEARNREHKARRETEDTKERFGRLLEASRSFTHTLLELKARQHKSRRRLATQHAIDGVLEAGDHLPAAASGILKVLGEKLGWQVAALWIVDDEKSALRCGEVWQQPGPDGEASACGFEEACRETEIPPGEGLPGRVWARNRSLWARDLSQEKGSRREVGVSAGLRGALAFPINVENQPVGVIELLGADVLKPDRDLLYTVDLIGRQLGQFVERQRAELEREKLRFYEVGARAEAAERERISRELHDRVAHSIGVVHQSLQLHEALRDVDPKRAAGKLRVAQEMARRSLEQTRNLSLELRRSETENGLVPALQDLLEIAVPDDVKTELSVSGETSLLSERQRGQVYLILREAVRNAVRHSGCSRITVGLDVTPQEFSGFVR